MRARLVLAALPALLACTEARQPSRLEVRGAFASDPTILKVSGGSAYVGILGNRGELWSSTCAQSPCDQSESFGNFQPTFGDPPPGSASAPSMVAWGNDRIDVFVLGRDQAIWHQTWDRSYWLGWESLGGVLVGAPAATTWGKGRLDVFAVGPSGAVFHMFCQALGVPGCRGSGWTQWLPELGAPPSGALGDVRAISGSGEFIELVVLGRDGHVYHRSYDRYWQGWQSLGEGFAFAPAVTRRGSEVNVYAVNRDGELLTAQGNNKRFKKFRETGLTPGSSVAAVSGRKGDTLAYRDPEGRALLLAHCDDDGRCSVKQ